METRKLGNSDLKITPVGFGAWAIGGAGYDFGWGPQEDAESIAAIHRALELGVNWIDTAAVYGIGHSEEVVARALKEWRGARPYVFTKCVDALGRRKGVSPKSQGRIDPTGMRRQSATSADRRDRSLPDSLAAGK